MLKIYKPLEFHEQCCFMFMNYSWTGRNHVAKASVLSLPEWVTFLSVLMIKKLLWMMPDSFEYTIALPSVTTLWMTIHPLIPLQWKRQHLSLMQCAVVFIFRRCDHLSSMTMVTVSDCTVYTILHHRSKNRASSGGRYCHLVLDWASNVWECCCSVRTNKYEHINWYNISSYLYHEDSSWKMIITM